MKKLVDGFNAFIQDVFTIGWGVAFGFCLIAILIKIAG